MKALPCLLLLSSILVHFSVSQNTFTPPNTGERFVDFIITDSKIVLATTGSVHGLSEALSREQSRSLLSASRLLVADSPTGTLNGTILTCDNSTCSLLETINFENVKWQVDASDVLQRDSNVALGSFSIGANGTSDLLYGDVTGTPNSERFVKAALRNVMSTTRPNEFFPYAVLQPNSNANFRHTFTYSDYTYFIIQVGETEMRVVRFCNKETGNGRDGGVPRFKARYEIVLSCRTTTRDITSSTATFQETPSGPDIFLAVNTRDSNTVGRSEVCMFSVDEINRLMQAKLTDCASGIGVAGFGQTRVSCPTHFMPQQRQTQIDEPCELRTVISSGLEVDTPLVATPLITFSNGMEQFLSLTVTTLDSQSFLFAGTSTGSIFQYHINTSTASLVRTLQPEGNSVLKMLPSDNGLYLYTMTQEVLRQRPVDMCRTQTTCSECSSSPDPVCGWCALHNSCTRQSDCAIVTDRVGVNQTVWLQQADSCPTITMATPLIIYLEDISDTISASDDIVVLTENIATNPNLLMFDYQCHYDFNVPGAVSIDRPATRSEGSFTCSQPLTTQVPQIPAEQDSVEITISLTVRNVELVTTATPIEITDCSLILTCTGCITSGSNKCRWCPFDHICIPDRPPFQCSPTIGQSDQCPMIMAADSYLVHVGHQYDTPPLRISTSDLSSFRDQFAQGEFECVICAEGGEECTPLFSVTASLDPSGVVVQCEEHTYTTSLNMARFSAQLQLVAQPGDRRIDNPDDTRVMLYDCGLLGTNCGQCLAIPDNYSCSFCNHDNRCQLSVNCPGESYTDVTQFGSCQEPIIESLSPSAGPVEGETLLTIRGTNLGADISHIQQVRVGNINCAVTDYSPGVMVQCRTSAVGNTYNGSVSVLLSSGLIQTTELFSYQMPVFRALTPSFGPISGGSNITLSGSHLHIGTTHSVTVGGVDCPVTEVSEQGVVCTTPVGMTSEESMDVRLTIDGWSGVITGEPSFRYLLDPTFESISPKISFMAGGTSFIVRGTNLNTVQDPRLLIYVDTAGGRSKRQTVAMETEAIISETCTLADMTGTQMTCPAPSVTTNQTTPITVRFGLLMDGVEAIRRVNGSLLVYSDPSFNQLGEESEYPHGQPISLTIRGSGFVFTVDQIRLTIGPCSDPHNDVCNYCSVHNISNQDTLTCILSNTNNLPQDQSLTVTVRVGSFSQSVGSVRVASDISNLIFILAPIIAGVVLLSIIMLIILVAVFHCKTRQKDQRYDLLMLELEKMESNVARECKLGFAELQTDLDEITDIAGCRLPYRDMQSYLLTTLFPGAKDHSVLHPLQVPSHRLPQLNRALEDFNHLIHDKKVLLLMIRSLEEQRGFNIRDKALVGSLLMVALINRFDYATDVLKSLLSELIGKTVAHSSPKLLLRRTDSVAERMLTNWLAFCLHGYILEHVGQPLYLTYRAVKTQLEKGPIDVITGEARYSLSEQKLIRQKVDVEVVDVQVDSEDGLRVPVKLLDCDTISQAKEKLLDATFKTAPISQRPTLKSVDLVYVCSPKEQLIFRDEDPSMEREGGWKKINTLKHYGIKNGALFRLVRRKDHPGPGKTYDYPGSLISSHSSRQRGLSEAEDGSRVWHLFKQLDVEDPRRSPFLNKKMVTEIYLPRMLSTKSILQKFVDDLFDSLFTISHPPVSPTARYSSMFPQSPAPQLPMGYTSGAGSVPMAVKYLFDFLDDEAEAARVGDPDVVHMWKNNALSLRFWVNMIKNPEFVFDINKSHTVDACLSVIAQAFIDGCSFADTKLNIDSPTSKLLYNKEVQGYRTKVKQYYQDIHNLPRVPEDAMQNYLKQLSVYQAQMTRNSGGFVVESALQDLLRYAAKYSDHITTNLRSSGLEAKAQLFDGIVKVFQS